jgi:hypothetical protein
MNCKHLLDGRYIGRPCEKNEKMSCKYYGHCCYLDEQKRITVLSNINWDDDDGYPD